MDERRAWVGLNGWHGLTWSPVYIVGETPKRYRIRADRELRLAGRHRWLNVGDTVLVPKTAIKFEVSKKDGRILDA